MVDRGRCCILFWVWGYSLGGLLVDRLWKRVAGRWMEWKADRMYLCLCISRVELRMDERDVSRGNGEGVLLDLRYVVCILCIGGVC